MTLLLVLRPEPGASATVARAAAMGLEAIAAPLFEIVPLPFDLPDGAFDALLFTSANAVRAVRVGHDGPVYAVGPATAAAAREAGFMDIRVGEADAAAIVARAAGEGMHRLLHLAGREHRAVAHPGVQIERRIVYEARPTEATWPIAREALRRGAIPLLHSPRAAARFAELFEGGRAAIALAAISAATAQAAGEGWSAVAVAEAPNDAALLAAVKALLP